MTHGHTECDVGARNVMCDMHTCDEISGYTSDICVSYHREVSKHGIIPKKELNKMLVLAKKDSAIREKVILSNLRLVLMMIPKNFLSKKMGDVDQLYMDMVSVGNQALIEAIDDYDARKGHFIAYAKKCIRGKILVYMAYKHDLIRIPSVLYFRLRKICTGIDFGFSREEIAKSREMSFFFLEPKINEEGELVFPYDNVADESDFFEDVDRSDLKRLVRNKLKKMRQKDRTILRDMFCSGEKVSEGELARRYGVSRQAISIRYQRAIRNFRNKCSIRNLKEFRQYVGSSGLRSGELETGGRGLLGCRIRGG